jgi:hypothetical protein
MPRDPAHCWRAQAPTRRGRGESKTIY